jgi:hypothetical protein
MDYVADLFFGLKTRLEYTNLLSIIYKTWITKLIIIIIEATAHYYKIETVQTEQK